MEGRIMVIVIQSRLNALRRVMEKAGEWIYMIPRLIS